MPLDQIHPKDASTASTKRLDVNNVSGMARRIAYLPVSLFASVMGLMGWAIAWQHMDIRHPWFENVAWLVGNFGTLVFMLLVVAFTQKLIRYPKNVIAEFKHPIQINFLPTFSISLLLISVFWKEHNIHVFGVWVLGAILQLVLTFYVVAQWISSPSITLETVNPAWFMPAVGNIVVPLTGTYFGFYEISWFFFALGFFFWIILGALILYRLVFIGSIPKKIQPTLCIFLAPPSVSFIAFTQLNGGLSDFSYGLYFIAFITAMLLLVNIVRFVSLPFYLSSWAFSFPLAAFTIASFQLFELTQASQWWWFSVVLTSLLGLLLVFLSVKTIQAYLDRQIFVPEA